MRVVWLVIFSVALAAEILFVAALNFFDDWTLEPMPVFFVAAAFGELSHDILGLSRQWGMLINITEVMNMIWNWLFEGVTTYRTLPVWTGFGK